MMSHWKIKEILDRASTWTSLDNMGNLPVIKQSYLFIILIPIVARVLEFLESSNISLFKQINLNLPFNPFILYFGAALFLGSRIIIAIFIPKFIKDLPKYKTYIELKLEKNDLIQYPDSGENINISAMDTDKLIYDKYFNYFNGENKIIRYLTFFLGSRLEQRV